MFYSTIKTTLDQPLPLKIGMRELCWNNFRNNDEVKESRIIPEF